MRRVRMGWLEIAVLLGPAIGALALAVWGSVRVWQSASIGAETEPGVAIVLGAALFLCLWGWYRGRSGSLDAPAPGTIDPIWVGAAPVVALLLVAMLLGTVPRLFWPAAESIHLIGSIASKAMLGALIVVQLRRIVVEVRRRRVAGSSR